MATGSNDYEQKVTISEKVHPMNILIIRDPAVCTHENHKIPSILEIIDLKNKVFKVSAVALKKAPIMMCHYYVIIPGCARIVKFHFFRLSNVALKMTS